MSNVPILASRRRDALSLNENLGIKRETCASPIQADRVLKFPSLSIMTSSPAPTESPQALNRAPVRIDRTRVGHRSRRWRPVTRPRLPPGATTPEFIGCSRPVRTGQAPWGSRWSARRGHASPGGQRSLQRRGSRTDSPPGPTAQTASAMTMTWWCRCRTHRGGGRGLGRRRRAGAVAQHPAHAGATVSLAAQDRSAGQQLDARYDKQADQEDHRSGARQQRKSGAARRGGTGIDRWRDPSVPSSPLGRNHLGHVGRHHLGDLGSRIARSPHPGHDDLASPIQRPLVRDSRHSGDHRSHRRPDDGAVRIRALPPTP